MNSWIDRKALFEYLRGHFRLDWTGWHGAPHWSRVLRNGLLIARHESGVREDVVRLFAFLHDHERREEDEDFGHGNRAVLNAINLRGKYFDIDDTGFLLLCQAMAEHSDGKLEADITVQACWDADRLDLGRVGILPDAKYLCTAYAKNFNNINEAYIRSVR